MYDRVQNAPLHVDILSMREMVKIYFTVFYRKVI